MNNLVIALAAVGIAAVALKPPGRSKPAGTSGDDTTTVIPTPLSESQDSLRYHLEEAGLAPSWVLFFEAIALNESRFNHLTGLGNPQLFPSWAEPNVDASVSSQQREQRAATRAYERNAARFQGCGHPSADYTFGSGGWFGMLPANALAAFDGTAYQCMHPYFVFFPGASVVMAIEFARRLMSWSSWKSKPTFANLRVGWGDPSKMGDRGAISKSGARLKELLSEFGANPNIASMRPPSLPAADPVGLFDHLDSL